jgi:predicted SprT family Zn-dependent metalloprotease
MELQKAEQLAKELIKQHCPEYTFRFDKAKARFGRISYTNKAISLSKELVELNSESEVKNTLLHEIAHALTPGCKHNRIWQKKAIEIGGDGQRCYTADCVVIPKLKYTGYCESCGFTAQFSRIPKGRKGCYHCGKGRFDENFLIKYRLN